ncbi:MAG: hypothetical protein EOP38_13755 [Rubrivivax sp.]|nr:MAG: hypothetical protein EOP38_13755 [Rubrivivax sp.]
MNRSVLWSRIGVGAAVAVVMAAGSGSAAAQEDDGLALKMAEAAKPGRVFGRAGVIYVKVKTKSGDTYDVTGPVVTKKELENLFTTPEARGAIALDKTYANPTAIQTTVGNAVRGAQGAGLLVGILNAQKLDGIGTPAGIKGIAGKEMGTGGISLGYYLDEAQNWAIESYVLAAPLKTSVTATGRSTIRTFEDENGAVEQLKPFGLEGQKILTTKLLPPTVILGRYWGSAQSKFRPYTALMASYLVFFDTKASEALNNYVGGSNPGDTTVSIKNKFGVGPVLGLKYQFNDTWHLSLNVGNMKVKTQATLTTRNTFITSETGAIQDYGRAVGQDGVGSISDAISTGEENFGPNGTQTAGARTVVGFNGGLVATVSKGIAAARGQSNLGTYVRKTDTTLSTTLFMLSVGRSF